jgi:hypothetical protein
MMNDIGLFTVVYHEKDIDSIIEVLRKYTRLKHPIPGSLMITINNITGTDQRLAVYFHQRIVRYPSVRKAITALTATMPDTADDETPDTTITPPTMPGVLAPPEPTAAGSMGMFG